MTRRTRPCAAPLLCLLCLSLYPSASPRAGWPEEGLLVTTDISSTYQSMAPFLSPDGTGGCYLTWYDGAGDARMMRVDASGTPCWTAPIPLASPYYSWEYERGFERLLVADGLAMAAAEFGAVRRQVVRPDGSLVYGSGGQVFVHDDQATVQDILLSPELDTYVLVDGLYYTAPVLQRYDAAGTPTWGGSGLTVSGDMASGTRIALDAGGGFFLGGSRTSSGDRTITIGKYDAAGNLVWSVPRETYYYTVFGFSGILADGDGGVYYIYRYGSGYVLNHLDADGQPTYADASGVGFPYSGWYDPPRAFVLEGDVYWQIESGGRRYVYRATPTVPFASIWSHQSDSYGNDDDLKMLVDPAASLLYPRIITAEGTVYRKIDLDGQVLCPETDMDLASLRGPGEFYDRASGDGLGGFYCATDYLSGELRLHRFGSDCGQVPVWLSPLAAAWVDGALEISWCGEPLPGESFRLEAASDHGAEELSFVRTDDGCWTSRVTGPVGATSIRLYSGRAGDWVLEDRTAVPERAGEAAALALSVAPNPANPRASIMLELDERQDGTLAVFDLRGRHVATLWSGSFAGGSQKFFWDGRDGAGRTVASGTYFAQFRSERRVVTRRFAVIR